MENPQATEPEEKPEEKPVRHANWNGLQPGHERSKGKRPGRSFANGIRRILKGSDCFELDENGELQPRSLPEGMTVHDFLCHLAVARAMRGDPYFYTQVSERADGKVPQRVANADGSNLPRAITVVEVFAPQPALEPPRVIDITPLSQDPAAE